VGVTLPSGQQLLALDLLPVHKDYHSDAVMLHNPPADSHLFPVCSR